MQKDVIIIGAGPGGYTLAVELSKQGRKVTLIEKDNLGGTCLNYGCMPTKSLLHSASNIIAIKESIKNEQTNISDFTINYEKIIDDSRKQVETLKNGIDFLMKKNKVEVIKGEATFISNGKLKVTSENETIELEGNDIIIATGSYSRTIPNIEVNNTNVFTSKSFLLNKVQPKNILIIGSGSIGIEFASFLNAIGTNVTVVEMAPNIMPLQDSTISNTMKRYLKDKGMVFYTSATVSSFENDGKTIKATIKTKDDKEEALEFDSCLVSIGVIPNTKNLELENTDIKLTDRGFIEVDNKLQTTTPHHFAIGDIIGAPTLAHVAIQEAKIVTSTICNLPCNYTKENIPLCTYTIPQVASVGITEDYAKQNNIAYKTARFPFSANGKAIVSCEEEGMIKLIYDPESLKILGCHLIQKEATELLGEVVLAKNLGLTLKDIEKTIHAHPTLSEAIGAIAGAAL